MRAAETHLPLLEEDLAEPGLISPKGLASGDAAPSAVVICFFAEVIERLARRSGATRIGTLMSASGPNPVFSISCGADRVAVFHPGVGAPIAVGFLEEVIAAGGRSFVAVGGAGALLPDLVLGHPVVVESAVRDEGTSFHYAAPSRTINADPVGIEVLRGTLDEIDADYLVGRT